MTSQTKKSYLERKGMACASCSSPDLELKSKFATTEIKDDKAFLLIPVICDTCGWKGQETYQLVDVDNLLEEKS